MCIPKVYNAKEAADILKVKPETIRIWVRTGRLNAIKSIKKVRITEDEIKRFIGIIMIKAIETEYNGYRFRSRLEARWAVFFDALGIEYEYEKEGYDLGELGWYLPDFWLPKLEMFIEVKGQEPTEGEKEKIYKLSKDSGFEAYILTNLPTSSGINTETKIEAKEMNLNRFTLSKGKPYKFNKNTCFGVDIRCPVCGFDYVHFSDPISKNGNDNYEAWEGRGDALKIPMCCENGHSWNLRFGFHKGQTFYDFIDIMGTVEVNVNISCKFTENKEKIKEAAKAAKSARFEHGETPGTLKIKPYKKKNARYINPEPADRFQEYKRPAGMSLSIWETVMDIIFMQGDTPSIIGKEIHLILTKDEFPDEYIEGLRKIIELNCNLKEALQDYTNEERKRSLFDF